MGRGISDYMYAFPVDKRIFLQTYNSEWARRDGVRPVAYSKINGTPTTIFFKIVLRMNRLNGTSAPGDGVRALPCSKKGGDQKKYYGSLHRIKREAGDY